MSNYEYITEEEMNALWAENLNKQDIVGSINKLLASKAQTGYCIVNEEECAYITSTAIRKIRTPYNNGDSLDDTHIAHVFFEPLKPAEPECDHTIEIPHAVWPNDGESKVVWRIAELIKGDCFKCGKPLGGEK